MDCLESHPSLPMERHGRRRKKRLLNAIREQIEFYFSDANLRHDRFMRQLIGAEDPDLKGRQAVHLNEFLKFNKISEMTQNIRDISLALQRSKCLSLDEKSDKVHRMEPFVTRDVNCDDLTIYVERLPPNADHHWIREVFAPFGPIQYIKVPHFRHNNNIMGFAFIEFEDKVSAEKALKHFNALSSDDTQNSDQMDSNNECEPKLPADQTQDIPELEVSRKRSHDATDEEISDAKRAKVSENDGSESDLQLIDKNDETISETNCETNCETISTKVKEKKKKRRKKRTVITPDLVEDNVPEVINLRVMSKKEWKRWKNKYLKLQKQSMAALKRSLLVKTDTNIEQLANEPTVMAADNTTANERSFESGLIIKLNFTVSSMDFNDNEFKRNIRLMAEKQEISYIDLPKNRIEFKDSETLRGVCYIRTNSGDDCQQMLQKEKLKQLGDLNVLCGTEETDYWNQIFDERIKKKWTTNNEKKPKHKTRGFDRIINRAENAMTSVEPKLNKHIKFDN